MTISGGLVATVGVLPSSSTPTWQKHTWALRAYGQAAIALARAKIPQDITKHVCEAIVEQDSYVLAFIAFAEEKEAKPILIVGAAGPALGYLDGLKLSWSEEFEEGRGPAGRAVRSGSPYIVQDTLDDPTFHHWRERADRWGIRSSVTVPFSRGGKTNGVFCVYANEPHAFGHEDIEVFSHLGDAIGFAFTAFEDKMRLDLETLRLQRLVAAVHSPIISINNDGKITVFNAAAEKVFGYSALEVMDQPLNILIPSNLADGHDRHVMGFLAAKIDSRQMAAKREVHGRRKNGEQFPIEVAITRIETPEGLFATAIIHDLSERKALEEKLVQSAKMEALGQLAGGIAHDFNNLLAIILNGIDIAGHAITPDSQEANFLLRAKRSCERGADLVSRMMRFSRQAQAPSSIVNLTMALGELISILQRTLGKHIEIESRQIEADLYINVEPALLETSILNLAFNARDAMPNGGVLEFIARRVPEDEGSVELVVRDNGAGIPAEIKERIFEPFFTTKAIGKGTGLGLSTVANFVNKSGGKISVDSTPGMGTNFVLRFPEVTVKHAVAAR